jgi:hypothetical protein
VGCLKGAIINEQFHPSLMFRSYYIKKYKLIYNVDYKYSGDFDFIARGSSLLPFEDLSDVLIYYRLHRQQISTEKRDEQIEYTDLVRLNQLRIFNINFNKYEKQLYLGLIKYSSANDEKELEEGMNIFNVLLAKNAELRIQSNYIV